MISYLIESNVWSCRVAATARTSAAVGLSPLVGRVVKAGSERSELPLERLEQISGCDVNMAHGIGVVQPRVAEHQPNVCSELRSVLERHRVRPARAKKVDVLVNTPYDVNNAGCDHASRYEPPQSCQYNGQP